MKADISIKWRSDRAADCPLVEEKTCVSERSPEVCPWQERFSLRLSDDEEHRSASCWLKLVQRQQLSGQPRSLFLSVSKDAVCLCLKSGAVSDFHADVRLEQAADFWGFLMNPSLLVCGFKHQTRAATWVQLREDSVKAATPTGHLLWSHVITPLLFCSSLSFLVHGQQTRTKHIKKAAVFMVLTTRVSQIRPETSFTCAGPKCEWMQIDMLMGNKDEWMKCKNLPMCKDF